MSLKALSYSVLSLSLALTTLAPEAVVAQTASKRERKLYVGSDSTEAIMTFKHEVEISTTKKVTAELAEEQIRAQLTHLFGPMGEADVKAVPKGDETITQIKITKRTDKPNTYVVNYNYKGTIVLQNGPDDSYPVLLPVNPKKVYKAGVVTIGEKPHNPCTDHHYQSEGDFWYF